MGVTIAYQDVLDNSRQKAFGFLFWPGRRVIVIVMVRYSKIRVCAYVYVCIYACMSICLCMSMYTSDCMFVYVGCQSHQLLANGSYFIHQNSTEILKMGSIDKSTVLILSYLAVCSKNGQS